MSGGRLVVLDRLGREVKRFLLASGLATLGSHPRCDIRVMQPTVCPHHATVVVHHNQTVVRNVGDGETLVNGQPVSVAALRHGDLITVGDRSLRWDYDDADARRPLEPQPALHTRSRQARGRVRASAGAVQAPRSPSLQLALEMHHRSSMPGSAGGKQVAIVQPQRRDTSDQNESLPVRGSWQAKRQSALTATKASLWIESRKTTPRKAANTGGSPLRRATPLRLSVLKRVAGLAKVQPPAQLDQTKQVAIMLMTGHTPKSKLSNSQPRRTPSFLVKKRSPVATPRGRKSPGNKSASTLRGQKTLNNSSVATARGQETLDHSSVGTPRGQRTLDNSSVGTSRGQKTLDISSAGTSRGQMTLDNSSVGTPRGNKTLDISSVRTSRGRRTLDTSSIVTPRGLRKLDNSSVATRRRQNTLVNTPDALGTPGGRKTLDNTARDSNGNTSKMSSSRKSTRSSAGESVSILEKSDSTTRQSSPRVRSSHSRHSPIKSPLLPSPKKSAMKDPTSKKSSRKAESIKFDLSNLENHSEDEEDLIDQSQNSISEENSTHHYETSDGQLPSPSPRRSIHSRSSQILEKTLGSSISESSVISTRSTLTPQTKSPARKSRSSIIIQKALDNNESGFSRRSTKTSMNQSGDATVASAFRTKTLSPRSPQNNLESYTIVDLVSIDSNESRRSTSIYNSAESVNSAAAFGTPYSGRKTRSTIDPVLVVSSTPYVGKTKKSLIRSQTSPNISLQSSIKANILQTSGRSSASTRRSKSLTTPENTLEDITVNSSRVSRASRSRSRLSESDILLISGSSYAEDVYPRSSKKNSPKSPQQKLKSANQSSHSEKRNKSRRTVDVTPNDTQNEGMSTPENRHSPEEVGTPILNIQSLIDSQSQNLGKKTRVSVNVKRKTIGAIRTSPKKRRTGFKSKSLNFTARRALLRLSNDSEDGNSGEKMVTPKSAVKLVQEAVKNKHSTAKKPQSKRSIIDNLDESDIVKQLFNSPVKRKLSQSMTEFSRKQLYDDEEIATLRRPTRNTIALTGRSPDNSILEQTVVFTPERFVSPIGTPAKSPDLGGIKRLFRKNTPDNDLTNVKGVKSLLKTPRTRKSVKNDLTNVSGVKKVFAKSPKNRLSDVRVKEVFAAGPKNDLRRVTGVKSLFRSQESPRNDLTDVRGVKRLFQRSSPANDLRRVSGVKRVLDRNSPRNDLRDVRGVKRMFAEEKGTDGLTNVSGVEELFNESIASKDTDILFDQLLGRPPVKAKHSKSLLKKSAPKRKSRPVKCLHVSIDSTTNNVQDWLEKELQKRLHKDNEEKKSINRELQNLATDTVEGVAPIIDSRVRRSFVTKDDSERKSPRDVYSAHILPIKKRSLLDKTSNLSNRVTSDSVRSSLRVSNNLPLKKRVLHSTPLKGKKPGTPVLGRVSPIPQASDHDTSIISDQVPKDIPEPPKSRSATKVKIEKLKPSPTHTPANNTKNSSKTSISKKRATKSKQHDTTRNNTRKTTPSVVITKKSPIKSPKWTRKRTVKVEEPAKGAAVRKAKTQKEVEVQKDSAIVPTKTVPNKTRGRKQVEENVPAVQSPKKMRGRKQTEVKDVVKKETREQKGASPKASPKHRRGRKQPENKEATIKEVPNKAGRKRPVENDIIPKNSPKTSRTRRTEIEKPEEPSPKKSRIRKTGIDKPKEPSPKKTRTRKTEVVKPKEATPKRTRAKVQKNVVVVSKPSPQLKLQKQETATRMSRKTTASEMNGGDRDTKRRKVESKGKTRTTEDKDSEVATKRGRKNQPAEKPKVEIVADNNKTRNTRTRNVHTQDSTQSEPTSKRRRNEPENSTIVPETKSRKRKTTAEEIVPNKVAKKNADTEVTKKATRGKKTVDVEEQKESNTRQKRGAVKESKMEADAPATRGGKASAPVEPVSKTNTRKRKIEVEASSVKAEPQKSRSTRASAAIATSQPAGRSRRR